MKKIIFKLVIFISVLLSGLITGHAASTSSETVDYIRRQAYFENYGSEQTAPLSISQSGIENINTYKNTLNYSSTDLQLKGKNGLDVDITRNFTTASVIQISNKIKNAKYLVDYYNPINNLVPYYAIKYYTNPQKTEFIYVGFESLEAWKAAEKSDKTLLVPDNYLSNLKSVYAPSSTITQSYYYHVQSPGPFSWVYIYGSTGNKVLYRAEDKSPVRFDKCIRVYCRMTSESLHGMVSLGSYWGIYLPSIRRSSYSQEQSDKYRYKDYIYNFFDPDMGDDIKYYITYRILRSTGELTYESHDLRAISITGSEINTAKYKIINSIEYDEEIDDNIIAIERYDGVQLHFNNYGEILKKIDRYGNEINYEWDTGYDLYITDTYGREITLSNEGASKVLKVDGVSKVVYSIESQNDNVVDPENNISDDNWQILKVYTGGFERSLDYYMRPTFQRWTVTSSFYVVDRGVTLEKIVLPTGATINYEYEMGLSETSAASISHKILKLKYETEKNQPGIQINRTAYAYNQNSNTCSITTDLYTQTDYYNTTHGQESIKTSTQYQYTNPNKTIKETYTYQWGSTPLVTQTNSLTQIAGKGITQNNTYSYNSVDQPISQNQNGRLTTYTYGDFGQLTEQKQKVNDTTYYGIKNTLSADGKSIIKSQNFKQIGENYQFFEENILAYNQFGEVIQSTAVGDGGNNIITNIDYNYSPAQSHILFEKTTSIENVEQVDGGIVSTVEKYDHYGNLVYSMDANGNITQYSYDNKERPVLVVNPDSSTTQTIYNDLLNEVILINELGVAQKVTFDSLGRQKKIYSDEKLLTESFYDNYNQMIKKSLYSNDSPTPKSSANYTYYQDGAVKTEIVTEGAEILSKKEYSYAIDNSEFILNLDLYQTQTEKTRISQHTNIFGEIIKNIMNGNTQQFTYDNLGNLLTETDFKNNVTTYEYDHLNRQVQVLNADDKVSFVRYNKLGQAYLTMDFNGSEAFNTYNKMGQVIKTESSMNISDVNTNTETLFYYDPNGNLIKQMVLTDRDGTEKVYAETNNIYDNRNRLTAIISNDGSTNNVVKYEYNAAGSLLKMAIGLTNAEEQIDPTLHNVTSYEYNSLNQLIKTIDPQGKITETQYDYLNNPLAVIDRNGITANYIYDGLGRVTLMNAVKNGQEESIFYRYNLMGSITQMNDSSGDAYYEYNKLGQLVKETVGDYDKVYTYDPNGNRLSFTLSYQLNTELQINYEYDCLNRLIAVTNQGETTTYTYNNMGSPLSKNTNNKAVTEYQYNDMGLPIAMRNKTVEGEILSTYNISYYLDGNKKSIAETGKPTVFYEYDNMGRLVKEINQGQDETIYTYDNFLNRQSKVVKDQSQNIISTTSYEYNKNNWLLQEKKNENAVTDITNFFYDNNGNQVTKTYGQIGAGTGNESLELTQSTNMMDFFEYDAFNRLTKSNIKGEITSYTYNGNGLRQSKTTNGVSTNHIYDGQNIVVDDNGTNKQVFVRGLSLISRTVNGSNKEYYHFNTHGDTTALTNSSGSITMDYRYDAFGNQLQTANGNDTNPFRYCGEYFDKETGNIYLRARYYDPSVGRFISEDPHWNIQNMIYGDNPNKDNPIPNMDAIMQSNNLYVYGINNPLKYKDPSGLIAGVDDAAIVIVILGTAVITVSAEWLNSPEGQKLLQEGASVIYKGAVIAGESIKQSAINSAKAIANAWNNMFEADEGETSGVARAPKEGAAGSTYEQKDVDDNTRSKTTYGENNKPKTRDDYDHTHYDKKTKTNLGPHRHTYDYNEKGQRTGEEVTPIP